MSTHVDEVPRIAPFKSCIACFRGDTPTVVQVEGCAEWCIATLMVKAGLDHDDAVRSFLNWAEQDAGCEPGLVPDGRITTGFRLCRDCAARTGAKVTTIGEHGPVYRQPDEEPAEGGRP